MEENIQLTVLGKCLFSDAILRTVIEAEGFGDVKFTGACKDLFNAEFNLFKNTGVVDPLLAIEELRRIGTKDEISLVRSAMEAARKVTNNKVIEIIDGLLDDDNKEKILTCRERLKCLNSNILKTAAECIVNKDIKKIDKKGANTYRVRLSGGLFVMFNVNTGANTIFLSASDINRFPVSFKFIDDLYKEQQRNGFDNNTEEDVEVDKRQEPERNQDEQVQQVVQKPKSFFEKFLKH